MTGRKAEGVEAEEAVEEAGWREEEKAEGMKDLTTSVSTSQRSSRRAGEPDCCVVHE